MNIRKTTISRTLLKHFWILMCLCSFSLFAKDTTQHRPSKMDADLDNTYNEEKSKPINKLNDSLATVLSIEQNKSNIALEQYFRESLQHRKHTFAWQYYSSKIIFVVVLLTVLCGLIFSGFQFYYSILEIKSWHQLVLASSKVHNNATNQTSQTTQINIEGQANLVASQPESATAKPNANTANNNTELEVSLQGVKISSSLVGIIILAISICFFFLYMKFVYPIDNFKIDTKYQEIDHGSATKETR